MNKKAIYISGLLSEIKKVNLKIDIQKSGKHKYNEDLDIKKTQLLTELDRVRRGNITVKIKF